MGVGLIFTDTISHHKSKNVIVVGVNPLHTYLYKLELIKLINFVILQYNNISIVYKQMSEYLGDFKKFQLLTFSKCPSFEWSKKNHHLWSKTKKPLSNGAGIGIPTGKINNIIVVDLDFYKIDEDNLFIKDFGTNFIKEFNTLTTRTGSGGLHLFFNYDEDIKQTTNEELSVDIRSDGGYVVGAGTKVKKDGVIKEYIIENDTEIKTIPENLKKWLLDKLYSKEQKKNKKRKDKLVKVNKELDYYYYNIDDKEVKSIFNKLLKHDKGYWNDYNKWLIFMTALKQLNRYDLFLKIFETLNGIDGLKTRDLNKNIVMWNNIHKQNELNCFEKILTETGNKGLIDYIKFKPLLNNKMDFDFEKEMDKLGKHMKIETGKDYAFRSDTGTGKTTITKQFLKDTKQPFISIVSRRTLAYEQYKVFNEYGIDCVYYEFYKDGDRIPEGKSVVIQVDSLIKLTHYIKDISKYVVFLDEYSSLIEHFSICPTLKNTRIPVYKRFKKIIQNCKQIILADADLTNYTIDFVKELRPKLYMVNNTYKHNKGVKSKEWFKIEDMVKDLKSQDKFMVCMDTKSLALKIFNDYFNKTIFEKVNEKEIIVEGEIVNKYEITLGKDDKGIVAVITSDNDSFIDLDKYDRVIFSPKIIYGLDSTIKRPVYCFYKEHTISPKSMIQQIARSRNIEHLNYIYFKKQFVAPKYLDLEDTADFINKTEEIQDKWEWDMEEEDLNAYKKLLNPILYNNDCFETNKFGHFKYMIKQRGFIDEGKYGTTDKKYMKELLKEHQEDLRNNFDLENPKVKELNELFFHFDDDAILGNKDLFLDCKELEFYQNIKTYLLRSKESVEAQMKNKEEFSFLKIHENKSKIIFFEKFLQKVGAKNKLDFEPTKTIEGDEGQKIYQQYEILFKNKITSKLSLDTLKDVKKIMVKMVRQLFGKEFIVNERKTIAKGKKEWFYNVNEEMLKGYWDLFKYKFNNDNVELNEEIQKEFGKEDENFIYKIEDDEDDLLEASKKCEVLQKEANEKYMKEVKEYEKENGKINHNIFDL